MTHPLPDCGTSQLPCGSGGAPAGELSLAKAEHFTERLLHPPARELRRAFTSQIEQLSKPDFIRAWCAVAYTFPGLPPDSYEDAESGWPRALRRFADEAWRRTDAGEVADEELYPCDTKLSGLYDRIHTHEDDENQRRFQIAADYGERADG